MKRFLVGLILAAPAAAQEATLTVPVTRTSEAKYVVSMVVIEQSEAKITVTVRDSGNADIRSVTYPIPDPEHPTATVAGLLTALDTVRATETGGVLRRANFRILGFLADNGYLSGVTLVP